MNAPASEFDFVVLPWDFCDTEATVEVRSERAKKLYPGIVSLQIKMSQVEAFCGRLRDKYYLVS